MSASVLVVEDEALAAQALAKLLRELAPELRQEPPLASVAAALTRLAAPPAPALVMLDVQLADGLCFELFDALSADTPVIFTTAYDEYALRAFEVYGLDYLLKPVRPERLAQALAKWRRLRGQAPAARPSAAQVAGHFLSAQRWRERFLVSQGSAMRTIAVDQVAYFVKEHVVRLVTRDGHGYTLDQTLEELEGQLPPARFFRLNRQVLAQVDAIGLVHRGSKGRLEVELRPALAATAVVSQERAGLFRDWLDGSA